MMSCSSSTKPKSGSLSGRVILVNDTDDPSLDPVDFSGVTIALYELAVLDTTLVRIIYEYPDLGVPVSQLTQFDHRTQSPSAVTTSDAEGNFDIQDIKTGLYNVVVFKSGWGYKCFYSLDLSHALTNITIYNAPLVLKPEIILESYTESMVSFESHRVYRVVGDATINGPVVINQDALILMDPGARLSILSDGLTTQGDRFWKITSSVAFYSVGMQTDIQLFGRVLISSDDHDVVL
jgi:hypothetical protein